MFACSYPMNYVKLFKLEAKLHREICAEVERDFDALKWGKACIQIISCLTR